MKGIIWDDKPEDYFVNFPIFCERFGIEIEIFDSEIEFCDKFRKNKHQYDFIIVDLIREDAPATGENTSAGPKLLNKLMPDIVASKHGINMPVFIVTSQINLVTSEDLDIPLNLTLKSKSTSVDWLAMDIHQELKTQGVYVNTRKVFLIYGHDQDAQGTTDDIRQYLIDSDIEVVQIKGSNFSAEIMTKIVTDMNDCAAIIGICTPDDELKNGCYQPRANVLTEIGIALGLNRGLNRLVLLQRWGKDDRNKALLPSDFGGIMSIRFDNKIENYFDELSKVLIEKGVEINV